MLFRSIEEIEVWQRSCRLVVTLLKSLDSKELWRKRSLKEQIERAAISIPSNIAEGYERNSTRDFIRFLHIAKGSCGELRTQLYILKALSILPDGEVNGWIKECKELSSMVQGLINGLRARENPDK